MDCQSCGIKVKKERRPLHWSLLALIGLEAVPPSLALSRHVVPQYETQPVTVEIRYHAPNAGEAFLVWGTNGWKPLPEHDFPAGTILKNGIMYTLMRRLGETFIVKLQLLPRTLISYGFLITKIYSGDAINVWDGRGTLDDDYQIIAIKDTTITLATSPQIRETLLIWSGKVPLVTQEVRYFMPEAGEVFIVWGVNDWAFVPSSIRPYGTVVKDSLMHTLMRREGNTFIAKLQVPLQSTIDYGFLITKKRGGRAIKPIWDGDREYQARATPNAVIEINETMGIIKALAQVRPLPTVFEIGLYLCAGFFVVLVVGERLCCISLRHCRKAAVVLVGLTVAGLVLRLWIASSTYRLIGTPALLNGDESRYDDLAYALLQGHFFEWPGSTPVYPLFLAACYFIFGHSYAAVLYVQAFVGALAIPLTYWLARRFTQQNYAMLAALLVAISPMLILQVNSLYTEVLYTALLLLTLLSMLWALETPSLGRFTLIGVLLAISTLCRPGTALMPLIFVLLMPRTWSLKKRAALLLACVSAMIIVIAPWTYHNYRTTHKFIPFSLSLAMLWAGSPEFYHVMQQKQNAMTKIWDEELNPARNGGINPVTVEGDRYFNARAIASIKAEPGVYAWYSLQKLLYFWIGHPAADYDWPFNFKVIRTYCSTESLAGLYASRMMVVVALLGLIVLRHHLRDFALLLAVCGYFMLVHAILVPIARYSEPLYPILAVIIAAAVGEMAHRMPASAGNDVGKLLRSH